MPTPERILLKNNNKVNPLITNHENTYRPSSASFSVTMLNFTSANSDERTNAPLPVVQLTKFLQLYFLIFT